MWSQMPKYEWMSPAQCASVYTTAVSVNANAVSRRPRRVLGCCAQPSPLKQTLSKQMGPLSIIYFYGSCFDTNHSAG